MPPSADEAEFKIGEWVKALPTYEPPVWGRVVRRAVELEHPPLQSKLYWIEVGGFKLLFNQKHLLRSCSQELINASIDGQ